MESSDKGRAIMTANAHSLLYFLKLWCEIPFPGRSISEACNARTKRERLLSDAKYSWHKVGLPYFWRREVNEFLGIVWFVF